MKYIIVLRAEIKIVSISTVELIMNGDILNYYWLLLRRAMPCVEGEVLEDIEPMNFSH